MMNNKKDLYQLGIIYYRHQDLIIFFYHQMIIIKFHNFCVNIVNKILLLYSLFIITL